MKFLTFFPLTLSAMLCMGAADAQMLQGRGDQMLLTQYRLGGKNLSQERTVDRQPGHRRFLSPGSGNAYQQYENPQQAGRRPARMTRDERRALRRQINEANQGIYKKKQNRPASSQP